MPDQNHKKAKTININLTEVEYEKVKQLAEVRDLNPTAYTRLTALGNRIKPTVIQPKNERITELENENKRLNEQLNKGFGRYEISQEEYESLEEKYFEAYMYRSILKQFLEYVQADGEYINLNGYKNDEKLKADIRDAIKELKNEKEG
ncbi:plasmid mobilization protein [Staphylococcus shinii]|uniref:plasmid mobilization protein n=1 Tax=Staphylococcus shinii TaxID=2912228 RepID=UPI003EEE3152